MREDISSSYLYFRHPTEYIIVLLPAVFGVVFNIFDLFPVSLDSTDLESLAGLHVRYLESFVEITHLISVFIISLFVSYRWTGMQHDGSYKFWLSHGVKKHRFFILVFIRFSFLLYLSNLLGIGLLFFINSYSITLSQLLLLNLGIIIDIAILMSFSIMISELLNNPELSTITFLLINVGLHLFLLEESSVIAVSLKTYLFFSNFQVGSILGSIGFLTILAISSLRLHLKGEYIT